VNASGLRRFRNAERGQALIEVALVLPLLFVLLVGTIDLGRLAQFDEQLASAARAGAQYGSLNLVTANDSTGMTAAAISAAPALSGVTVPSAGYYCTCANGSAVTCTGTACASTHRLLYVRVTTTATFHPFFHYFINLATARSRTAILEVGQ
jgi:Flp pilus assembly protein TadG